MVPPKFLDPRSILTERVGFWQGVNVRLYLHGPSLEPLLCSGNVSLRLRHASRNCEECPYNRLRSYPLDAVNRSDGLILKSVYLDIRGVVHH